MVVRSRRFNGRSSSENDWDFDAETGSIEFFNALKDPYRVAGGQTRIVPWPFERTGIRSHEPSSELVASLRNSYTKILSTHGLANSGSGMLSLKPKGGHGRPRDTLIISTHREDPESWVEPAREIQELIDQERVRQGHENRIYVEIRNHDKIYCDVPSVVVVDTPEYLHALNIEESVHRAVDKYLSGIYNTISWGMMGPAGHLSNRVLALLITVPYNCHQRWLHLESQLLAAITAIADSLITVRIEILPGELVSNAVESLRPLRPDPKALTRIPINGASIGPRGTDSAGSLGLYVWFHPPNNGQPFLCALTASHVVAAGSGTLGTSTRAHFDNYGLMSSPGEPKIIIDYPAPYDYDGDDGTKSYLEALVAADDDAASANQALQMMMQSRASGGFGQVIYTSGLNRQTRDKRRLDWALIRVKDTSGRFVNFPPPSSAITNEQRDCGKILGRKKYSIDDGAIVGNVGQRARLNDWVTKTGRTTALSCGIVDDLKFVCAWENCPPSKETSVFKLPSTDDSDCAKPGDFGSMVCNDKGEWIGMLIGMEPTTSVAIMTPATDIIEDVRVRTGGHISLCT